MKLRLLFLLQLLALAAAYVALWAACIKLGLMAGGGWRTL